MHIEIRKLNYSYNHLIFVHLYIYHFKCIKINQVKKKKIKLTSINFRYFKQLEFLKQLVEEIQSFTSMVRLDKSIMSTKIFHPCLSKYSCQRRSRVTTHTVWIIIYQ